MTFTLKVVGGVEGRGGEGKRSLLLGFFINIADMYHAFPHFHMELFPFIS